MPILSSIFINNFIKILLTLICINSALVNAQTTPALPFNLMDLQKNSHQLKDYEGKVLIVNFWASWCGPCREEFPAMNRAYHKLKDKNVEFIAINYGEDPQSVTRFLEQYPIDFSVLLDESNITSSDWKITVMPTTVIINSHSEIIETILGPREWDSESMISAILSIK